MTPTEQDKELRKLVHIVQNADTTYDAMQFIIADRKRVELEAMINELGIHQSHDRGLAGSIHMGRKDVDDRLAELQSTQPSNKSKE